MGEELEMRCKLCRDFYKEFPLQKSKIEPEEYIHKIDKMCSMSPIVCFLEKEKEWNCKTVALIRNLCYGLRKILGYLNGIKN